MTNVDIIENYRSDSHHHVVVDGTTMNDRIVTQGYAITDFCGESNVTMNRAIILDTSVCADSNFVIISPYGGMFPYAASRTNSSLTDDGCTWRDVCVLGDNWYISLVTEKRHGLHLLYVWRWLVIHSQNCYSFSGIHCKNGSA